MTLTELAGSTRVAATTSAATTSTGAATVLDYISSYVGTVATLVGIVLSLVLIYTHWRNGRAEYNKTKLEIELLKRERDGHSGSDR